MTYLEEASGVLQSASVSRLAEVASDSVSAQIFALLRAEFTLVRIRDHVRGFRIVLLQPGVTLIEATCFRTLAQRFARGASPLRSDLPLLDQFAFANQRRAPLQRTIPPSHTRVVAG